jgi:hypothetical protein
VHFIVFILSKFRTKLLAENHLIICERSKFDSEQKYSDFLLELMTLVSSANNIVTYIEFVLRGRSFIYYEQRGTRIDPWGTPCFIVLQSEIKFLVLLGDFGDTWWCSLLRHCATSWNVVSTVPFHITGIFRLHYG